MGIYFLMRGSCGFVLPKHGNVKYLNINVGYQFGIIDIVGSMFLMDFKRDQEDLMSHKMKMYR